MEKISFYIRSSKKKNLKVNYRLREGRDTQMFHRSDIVADLADLNKFNPNGSVKGRVSIYNAKLQSLQYAKRYPRSLPASANMPMIP